MRKIISTNWTSLDGYIADPRGSLDWILGEDELADYEINLVSAADILMLGRRTFTDFQSYWPNIPTNPNAQPWERIYAEKVNAIRHVAISSTLKEVTWDQSEIVPEITRESIDRLKQGGDGTILMYGSVSVVTQLSALGLIDEYHVLTHPVVLGAGLPYFQNIHNRLQLERVSVQPFKSGVTAMVFKPLVGERKSFTWS